MGVLDHLGRRPNGTGYWSPSESEAVLRKIRAGVDLEQDITLSTDECWVLLKGLERSASKPQPYRRGPRFGPAD